MVWNPTRDNNCTARPLVTIPWPSAEGYNTLSGHVILALNGRTHHTTRWSPFEEQNPVVRTKGLDICNVGVTAILISGPKFDPKVILHGYKFMLHLTVYVSSSIASFKMLICIIFQENLFPSPGQASNWIFTSCKPLRAISGRAKSTKPQCWWAVDQKIVVKTSICKSL